MSFEQSESSVSGLGDFVQGSRSLPSIGLLRSFCYGQYLKNLSLLQGIDKFPVAPTVGSITGIGTPYHFPIKECILLCEKGTYLWCMIYMSEVKCYW